MKPSSPAQDRIYRIVFGAVTNAVKSHGLTVPDYLPRSIAKRAAGTLTAQLPVVLAAKTARKKQTIG